MARLCTHAVWEPTVDGGLDEIGGEESERDRHVDFPDAATLELSLNARREEVAHIARWEVGQASREMPRRGTRRKANRIAARAEVTRIAGYRVLIRFGP